ncbi:hypothetical protein FRC01_011100, partial [Tulasnella sp. 417]
PPPTNTVVVSTSAHANGPSAAVPLPLPSIAPAPSDQTASEVIFNGSSRCVDDHTKCSTSASNPTATKHPRATLATLLSHREREIISLPTSRVVIPSLPAVTDDSEPQIVKNGLASPTLSAHTLLQIDEQTESSTSASTPTVTKDTGTTLPALFSRKEREVSPLRTSRVVIPSLPTATDDSQPQVVKNGQAWPAPSVNTLPQLPTAAKLHGVVNGDFSPSRARSNFATGTVSYEIETEDVDIIDPAGWRGKSLDEIATGLRRRGTATASRSITPATQTPSPFSSNGKSSSVLGSSAHNQPTPPTSIEPQQNHPGETGTPNYSPEPSFEPRSDTTAQEAEAVVPKLPDGGEEHTVESFRDDVPWQVQAISRLGWGREKLRRNARRSEVNEEWRWAKTEGKIPVGGRRRFTATLASMRSEDTSLSTDDEDDEVDAQGFSRSEQRKAEAASRAALAMPFYGATTSRAIQPLLDEEWDSLGKFAATPSTLSEVAQPQVPSSTGSKTDVVQTWLPPPPPVNSAGPVPSSTDIQTEVAQSWTLPPPPHGDATPEK